MSKSIQLHAPANCNPETHVVYIKREVPDPDNIYCGVKEIEIEVTVEVTRGHAGDYWTEPDDDEGEVIESSHELTEAEKYEAIEEAITKQKPDPDFDADLDSTDRPF
jgi:hypothetical protein|tara:strand:+ start:1116 stop:1436 length:321 start_codon:yes stop_codon:yes gene_type:complete